MGPVLLFAVFFAVLVLWNLLQEPPSPSVTDLAAAHARQPLVTAPEMPTDARSAR